MKKKQEEESYTIHTSAYNESSKLLELECKNCGAFLELTDRTHAVCPYCGQKYLIDEAKGTAVKIQVDYSGSEEMRRTVNETRRTLLVVFAAAVAIALVVLVFNIAARKSVFSSSDSDTPADENGQLLQIFCKDIFGKEFKDITPEEFAQIRYLCCTYERDGSENYNAVWYSFTDYQDCASEEEFQQTIKRWSYRTKQVSWPSDYTMFTGLTRIDTTDAVWLSLLKFAPDCQISYVDTDDGLDAIASVLNPQAIKVLHVGIMGNSLAKLEAYPNLEELDVNTNLAKDVADVSKIRECGRLKKVSLRCADKYIGLDSLGSLSQLESLSIDKTNLENCDFLKNLPGLKELSVYTGESPDLSMLSFLPNLERLFFLDSEYISPEGISAIAGLERLSELKIAVDEAECIPLLSQITTLKALDLHMAVRGEYVDYHELPVDVSALSGLNQLEKLQLDNFWDGEMTGLEGVLNLPGLTELRLGTGVTNDTAPILNPEFLEDNPSVRTLSLPNCRPKDGITGEDMDFGFLAHYPGLRELYLDGCDLTDISVLAALSDLRILSLQENEIQDYSALSTCKKLEYVCIDREDAGKLSLSADVWIDTEPYYTRR